MKKIKSSAKTKAVIFLIFWIFLTVLGIYVHPYKPPIDEMLFIGFMMLMPTVWFWGLLILIFNSSLLLKRLYVTFL